MRHLLFISIYILPILVCAQPGYIIKGTVRGAKNSSKVYLCPALSDYPTDSTYIIGERFTFKGSVAPPIEYAVQIPYPADEHESYDCTFWLENSRITINGELEDFDKAKVTGSASQLSYEKYVTEVRNVAEKQNSSYFDSISIQLTERFIRHYPSSFKSVQELFLLRQMMPFSTIKQLFSMLSPSVAESKYGKELQNFIESYTELKKGDEAPDFTFTSMDGKAFTLQSLKGKYVLLIFWAPWCAPCREENNEYNHIYNVRDTSQLAMLGISLDKKDEVIAAIKKDGVQWQNMVLPGNNNEAYADPLLYRYGIWTVPNNILIDPQGKIIGKKLPPKYERKAQGEGGMTKIQIKGELNLQLEQLNLISE